MRRILLAGLFGLGSTVLWAADLHPPLRSYRVTPSSTDPAIQRFNAPHLVLSGLNPSPNAELLLFLSGTSGQPDTASDLLTVAAEAGYRVISLAYNDDPAVVQVCKTNPDPDCSGLVRHRRIYGDAATSLIDDQPQEAIVNRLVHLLQKLDSDHPTEGWGGYLQDGALRWDRLVLMGHSQGAGMAAYMAQRAEVARVVLFSSPWDNYGHQDTIAPWILEGPGKTPTERWYGAYHARENAAALIARCYRALGIPDEHVLVFPEEPAQFKGENPYHLSVSGNKTTPRAPDGRPRYAPLWQLLIGTSP